MCHLPLTKKVTIQFHYIICTINYVAFEKLIGLVNDPFSSRTMAQQKVKSTRKILTKRVHFDLTYLAFIFRLSSLKIVFLKSKEFLFAWVITLIISKRNVWILVKGAS